MKPLKIDVRKRFKIPRYPQTEKFSHLTMFSTPEKSSNGDDSSSELEDIQEYNEIKRKLFGKKERLVDLSSLSIIRYIREVNLIMPIYKFHVMTLLPS